MRVANVYDINAKTYLIKLSRSGGETGESQKVVDFTFGSGDAAYHLILELYSSGNVILTVETDRRTRVSPNVLALGPGNYADCNYNILTLLRSYKDETKGVATMANHPYPIEGVKEPTTCDRATLEAALRAAAAEPTEKGPKTLKQAVGSALAYGPSIVEHCILSAGLKPSAGVEPSLLPPQSDL
eukprot:gene27048-33275_t